LIGKSPYGGATLTGWQALQSHRLSRRVKKKEINRSNPGMHFWIFPGDFVVIVLDASFKKASHGFSIFFMQHWGKICPDNFQFLTGISLTKIYLNISAHRGFIMVTDSTINVSRIKIYPVK